MQALIINNVGIKINADVNANDKRICVKRFIWNPSNCDYECDKSCDIEKYLD